MDNQHRSIKGYRELSQQEIDLMNEIKTLGENIGVVCDKIKAHIEEQRSLVSQAAEIVGVNSDTENNRLDAAQPELWENWGRCSAQLAMMELTRAVAQPTSF